MKFKRLAAFVLTAALSVSSVGSTAFAAKAVMVETNKLSARVTTITFKYTYGDVGDSGAFPKAVVDGEEKDELSTSFKNVSGYKASLSNTDLYKFVGWGTKKVTSNSEYDSYFNDDQAKTDFDYVDPDTKLGAIIRKKKNSTGNGTACTDGIVDADDTLILYPIFRRWKTTEEKAEYEADQKAKAKEADDESRWVTRLNNQESSMQKQNDITKNNVINKKDPAHEKIDTKQIQQLPHMNAMTAGISANGRKYTPADMKAIVDYLGLADNDRYFFYAVEYSKNYQLIPGKKAIVTLKTRDDSGKKEFNYSLSDARVLVYQITETGKVKIKDVKKGSNYASFITDQFGLYMMAIVPKGATVMGYDNPPTGEGDVVPVAMLAFSALGASCLLTVKKRREIEA